MIFSYDEIGSLVTKQKVLLKFNEGEADMVEFLIEYDWALTLLALFAPTIIPFVIKKKGLSVIFFFFLAVINLSHAIAWWSRSIPRSAIGFLGAIIFLVLAVFYLHKRSLSKEEESRYLCPVSRKRLARINNEP